MTEIAPWMAPADAQQLPRGTVYVDAHGTPRDRYTRPWIYAEDPKVNRGQGGYWYSRTTRYIDVIEDRTRLYDWEKRKVAIGMSRRPDLVLEAASHAPGESDEDRKALDKVVERAMEDAGRDAQSTIGTALHKICEKIDRGEEIGKIPPLFQADIREYCKWRTFKRIHSAYIEQMTVVDSLRVAGTPDRHNFWPGMGLCIDDLKTGRIDYGALKMAMQLAMYSRAVLYDPESHLRFKPEVNQQWGHILHLPAGQGVLNVYDIDLELGSQGVGVAMLVRAWRHKGKDAMHLSEDVVPGQEQVSPIALTSE